MKSLLSLLFLIFVTTAVTAQPVIYVGHIEEEIDLGLAPYVRRVIEEAEKNNASGIVFRVNTFGGRVDAATQIRDAIINSKIPVTAFIDKRAISAGALISLSCKNIVMVPGASIGASTVVDQTGKKVSEKYQSYMRSEMRATAEKNNRPSNVAEAMVDERIVIEGLVDSTQLVTLTSNEAVTWGIADTVLVTLNEVTAYMGYEDPEIVQVRENWGEDVVRFLNNPIISSLLIMIGMLGIFTEIKTPGFGLAGTAAIVALGLFFGAGYILELVSVIEIILFVAGVILLALEIFVIPGFGVFGILGILGIVGSLFLGLLGDFRFIDASAISAAIIQLAITILASAVMMYFIAKLLPKSRSFTKLILADNIGSFSGYSSSEPEFMSMVGETGKALTDLRPSGTAVFSKKRLDVVTAGEYIARGTEVEIVMVTGSKIVVEEKTTQ